VGDDVLRELEGGTLGVVLGGEDIELLVLVAADEGAALEVDVGGEDVDSCASLGLEHGGSDAASVVVEGRVGGTEDLDDIDGALSDRAEHPAGGLVDGEVEGEHAGVGTNEVAVKDTLIPSSLDDREDLEALASTPENKVIVLLVAVDGVVIDLGGVRKVAGKVGSAKSSSGEENSVDAVENGLLHSLEVTVPWHGHDTHTRELEPFDVVVLDATVWVLGGNAGGGHEANTVGVGGGHDSDDGVSGLPGVGDAANLMEAILVEDLYQLLNGLRSDGGRSAASGGGGQTLAVGTNGSNGNYEK